jgi:hypothetical protein
MHRLTKMVGRDKPGRFRMFKGLVEAMFAL